jgi:chromosome segregation ATPase
LCEELQPDMKVVSELATWQAEHENCHDEHVHAEAELKAARSDLLEAQVERDQARHVTTYWQEKAKQAADQRDDLRALQEEQRRLIQAYDATAAELRAELEAARQQIARLEEQAKRQASLLALPEVEQQEMARLYIADWQELRTDLHAARARLAAAERVVEAAKETEKHYSGGYYSEPRRNLRAAIKAFDAATVGQEQADVSV